MIPLTLLAAQKLFGKLATGEALQQQIAALATSSNVIVPVISAAQISLSSATPDLADRNMEMAYPRVCIYCTSRKNSQTEKFRSFSGYIAVVGEIWASADLITQVDQWIHFYVEAFADILQANTGDWGDGIFYPGGYEVQIEPPKVGGLGFVESAKVTLTLNASVN